MRRVLSTFIVLFSAFFISIEVHAATDGDYEYELVEDENGVISVELTAYLGEEKEVTVPSTIKGYPVVSLYNKCFFKLDKIEKIVIPDSVTTIGEEVFEGCESLKEITLSSNLTVIGAYAFGWCTSLQEIVIPKGVKTIDAHTFRACTSLKKVELGQVEYLGAYAFAQCKSLPSVHLPASLTEISEGVFENCTGLKKVICDNDKTLFNIQAKAFDGCTALETFKIPESCSYIGPWAFRNCTSLKEIAFPEQIALFGNYAFKGCRSLATVTFSGEPTDLIIGKGVFQNCTSLTTMTIPKTTFSILDSAFEGCTGLREFVIEENPDYVEYAQNTVAGSAPLTAKYGTVEELPLYSEEHPNGPKLDIGKNVFKNCSSLSSIRLPFQVVWIMEGSFVGCDNLKEVTVENAFCDMGVTGESIGGEPILGELFDQGSTAIVKSLPVSRAAEYCEKYQQPFESMGIRDGFLYAKDRVNRYWYEGGVRQGYNPNDPNYRGKEIYDPLTDAWYWLDNVNQGAVAIDKDVYQESLADDQGNIGKWVRYNEAGLMIKGWSKQNDKLYYFDPVYGTMYKGWKTIDGVDCFFNEITGIYGETTNVKQGWYVEDGKDYWYENGVRQGYDPDNPSYRGKEIYDPASCAWYWLDNVQNGAKAVDKEVYQESVADDEGNIGKWVRYDWEGHMIKGWYIASNDESYDWKTYYYDPVYGTMYKGWKEIDGVTYHFHEEYGYLLNN